MKKYEAPQIDSLNIEVLDVLMGSGITTNDSTLGFRVDVDGGDEIW